MRIIRWADVSIKFADEQEEKIAKPKIQAMDFDLKMVILGLCLIIVVQALLIMSSRPPVWWLWLPLIGIISVLGWEIWKE